MLIYAAIVLGTLVAAFYRPAVAAGLLICTYGLEQWSQSQSAFFWSRGSLTNFVTAGMIGIGVLLQLKNGRSIFRGLPREFWLVILLYLYAFASIVWSVYPEGTWEHFNKNLPYNIAFAVLLPLVIPTLRDSRPMFFSVLTIGTILSALLLMTAEWRGRSIRFSTGSAIAMENLQEGNPLAIASLGAYITIIAALMNFRGVARFWQIARYVVVGLGVALAVRSGSRGQSLGMGLAVLAMLPYSRRFRNLSSFLGFAISISLFVGVSYILFDQMTRSPDATRSARWTFDTFVETYQDSRLHMAGQTLSAYFNAGPIYWLIGIGSSASFDPMIVGFYPHLVPAEVLGELGVIGFTLYALVIVLAVRNLSIAWQYVKDDPEDRGLMATIGALFLFEFILTLKEGSMIGASMFFATTVILGRVVRSMQRDAAYYAELDAGGYVLTADELAIEAQAWGEAWPDEHDAHLPVAAGRV